MIMESSAPSSRREGKNLEILVSGLWTKEEEEKNNQIFTKKIEINDNFN